MTYPKNGRTDRKEDKKQNNVKQKNGENQMLQKNPKIICNKTIRIHIEERRGKL